MPPTIEYPSVTDYSDALQHPAKCFRDPALQVCAAQVNSRRDPWGRVGGMAIVYKLEPPKTTGQATRPTAVKVFKNFDSEREKRYQTLADHLVRVQSRYLIRFGYDREGIRIRKDGVWRWFPILTMEWVEGDSLSNWIPERLKRNDRQGIAKLADRLVELVRQMKTLKIAHGDLQHGNVLVVDDDLVLVDYDGMCVPALVGQPASESGLEAYQHPGRKDQSLSLDLDDFSAWVIWLSLRAVAADPSLWQRFVVQPKNENLLFDVPDLQNPERSTLWPELLRSRDAEVVRRATALLESLRQPFDKIPGFSFDRSGELIQLCGQAQPDWEQIVRVAEDVLGAGVPIPDAQQTVVASARLRLASRSALQKAIQGGDPRQILAAHDPALVDDWPACRTLVDEVRRVRPIALGLDEMTKALASPGDGTALVQLWLRHAQTLGTCPAAGPLRDEVERWRKRLEAATEMKALLTRPTTEQALILAWRKLEALGGHPWIDPRDPRLGLALQREVILSRLRNLPLQPSEKSDRELVEIWKDDVLQGSAEAAPHRSRWEAALQRVQVLDALEELIARGPAGQPSPDVYFELVARRADLPDGYPYARLQTVQHARDWLAGRDRLRAACDAGRWEEVMAIASGPVFARSPCPEALKEPVQRAHLRVQARRRLEHVLQPPLPRLPSLRRVAEAYQPDLLDDWPECAAQVGRARQARQLVAMLPPLEAASRNPGDGRELLARWRQQPDLPSGWEEIEAIRRVVDLWQPRVDACDALLAVTRETKATARAITEVWTRLEQAGGHPDAVPYQSLADLSRRRASCLGALLDVRPEATEEADRRFVAAWQEDLLADWWEAEGLRHRLRAASARVKLLDEVADLIQRKAPDEQIVLAAARLPGAYKFDPALQKTLQEARARQHWQLRLREVLSEQPASDQRIVEAWEAYRGAGLHLFEGKEFERCQLAVKRWRGVLALRALRGNLLADREDLEILQCWQKGGLEGCPDLTDKERQRHEIARQRSALWTELERSLALKDYPSVRRLAQEPLLIGYPPLRDRQEEVNRILGEGERLEIVLHVLEQGTPVEVVPNLDLGCLASNPATFRPHMDRLRDLLSRELGKVTLRLNGQPEWLTTIGTIRRVRIRWLGWSWRPLGLGDRLCRVVVHATQTYEEPDGLPTFLHAQSAHGKGGGLDVQVPPGDDTVCVTVWPVIRLEALGLEVTGAPLKIGPLAAPGAVVKKKGWFR